MKTPPIDNKPEAFWDAVQIRGLRRRLGWSQSDLARRLACDSEMVRVWEEAAGTPSAPQAQTLHMLFQQAELVAHEMTQSVQADANIQKNALDFVVVPTFDLQDKNS